MTESVIHAIRFAELQGRGERRQVYFALPAESRRVGRAWREAAYWDVSHLIAWIAARNPEVMSLFHAYRHFAHYGDRKAGLPPQASEITDRVCAGWLVEVAAPSSIVSAKHDLIAKLQCGELGAIGSADGRKPESISATAWTSFEFSPIDGGTLGPPRGSAPAWYADVRFNATDALRLWPASGPATAITTGGPRDAEVTAPRKAGRPPAPSLLYYVEGLETGRTKQRKADEARRIVAAWPRSDAPRFETVAGHIAQYHNQLEWADGRPTNASVIVALVRQKEDK